MRYEMRPTLNRVWAVGLYSVSGALALASFVTLSDARVGDRVAAIAQFIVGVSLLVSFILLRVLTDAVDPQRYAGHVKVRATLLATIRRAVHATLLACIVILGFATVARHFRPDFAAHLLRGFENRPETLWSVIGFTLSVLWTLVAAFGVNVVAAPRSTERLPLLFRTLHRLLPGKSIQKEIIEKERQERDRSNQI